MNIYQEMLEIAKENIEGLDYEEALYYLNNDAIPAAGSVTGLIYYSDTEQIAEKYYDEIIDLMKELYGNNIPTDLLTLNNMAWFAWEYYILGNGEQVLKDLGWKNK